MSKPLKNYHRDQLPAYRADLEAVMAQVDTDEIQIVLQALEAGRIDGMTYFGPCACLIGTIGNARWPQNVPARTWDKFDYKTHILDVRREIAPDIPGTSIRPIESFCLAIAPKNTPQNNEYAATLHGWLTEILAARTA